MISKNLKKDIERFFEGEYYPKTLMISHWEVNDLQGLSYELSWTKIRIDSITRITKKCKGQQILWIIIYADGDQYKVKEQASIRNVLWAWDRYLGWSKEFSFLVSKN